TLPGSDLLHDERIADMVGTGAAIGLGHQHAHKAELAELGHRLGRKPLLAIALRGKGRELCPGKIAGDVAQHPLLVGQSHDALPSLAVTSISIFIRGSTRPQTSAVAAGRIAPKTSPSTGTIVGQSAMSGM